MKVVVFTGAGASIELGVPTMRPMIEEFRNHLQERRIAAKVLAKLDQLMADKAYDIEHMIDDLDGLEKGLSVHDRWGEKVQSPLKPEIDVVRPEAEWFIQHVCERVDTGMAPMLWHPLLRQAAHHKLVIATTNYDRSVEIAAARHGIELDDGFEPFVDKEWVPWRGFSTTGGIRLLKVHGSTDWYYAADTHGVYKLSHPMPIFGRVTVRLEGPTPLMLKSAAVLPSREKRIREPPYPELSSEFRTNALDCDVAVFVGTSLRDPDLWSVCADSAKKHPTFLVNRNIAGGVSLPPDVQVITQSASRFLASTLPCALRTTNPVVALERAVGGKHGPAGILRDLHVALDKSAGVPLRCGALDRLLVSQVSLEESEVSGVLRDQEPDVRLYALGLLPHSPDRQELTKIAEQVAAAASDGVFAAEVKLLAELE